MEIPDLSSYTIFATSRMPAAEFGSDEPNGDALSAYWEDIYHSQGSEKWILLAVECDIRVVCIQGIAQPPGDLTGMSESHIYVVRLTIPASDIEVYTIEDRQDIHRERKFIMFARSETDFICAYMVLN